MTRSGIQLPRAAWLIIALYLLLAGLYAVVTPPFEKPDEHWHFAFAMYLADTGQLPTQSLGARDHLAEQEGSQPPLYYAALAALLNLTGHTDLERGFAALTEENPYYGGRPGAWRDNANQFVHTPCVDADCQRTERAVYLGRGLSIFFGALALLGAAAAVRLAFPARDALLLLVLAVIAFTPQFLHISSSVSNDAVTVAMVNIAFALGVAWLRQPRLALAIAAGAVVAMATLGKMSGLSVGVILGGALLLFGGIGWRARIVHLVGYGAAFLLVADWWFWRNIVLYGEPTATAIHLQVYGTPPDPLTWNTIAAEWRAVINSFWASFGWGGINPDDWVYTLVRWLLALFVALFVVAVLRAWRGWSPLQRIVALLFIGQLLLVGFLHFRWMRLTIAPLGRLMFPAILPIAFIIALPVAQLQRWGRGAAALVGAAWLVVALVMPVALIVPAYAAAPSPQTLPPSAVPVGARFGDSIVLEGYAFERVPMRYDIPAYSAGEIVPVTLYWRSTTPVSEHLSVGLKFFNGRGDLVSEYNSYPDGGRAPTTGWQPDTLIVDRAALLLAHDAEMPALLALEIDLFEHQTLAALPVTVGDMVVRPFRPAAILLRDMSADAPTGDAPAFEPVNPRAHVEGARAVVAFDWRVAGAPLNTDAQAFLHLTAPEDPAPLQTADFTPLGGLLPARYWAAGDLLPDEAAITLPTDLPPGDYQLLTGLYNPQSQQRIAGANGQTVWTLATLTWDGDVWRVN